MKTAICAINSKYIHSSLAPWCLWAGIKQYSKSNPQVTIIEATINEKIENIVDRICIEDYDIICISCYIWNISIVEKIIPLIKQGLPKAFIALGGPEVAYRVKNVFDTMPQVDFVLSGEGEKPIAALMDSISFGTEIDIKGISDRNKGNYIISDPYIMKEDPPSPYCDEYFKVLEGRIAYIEASRGCPFSCSYCLSGRCGTVRYFDLERIKSEIILLSNSGTKTLKFVDRTFNAKLKRAKEIVKFLKEEYGKSIKIGVCFHFEIAGDILDEEMLELLCSLPVGLVQLEIGMQSFNEKTLAAVNRKTKAQVLKNNITRLVQAKNMHIHIDLIAGLPFEDIVSFSKSFNIGFELGANMLQLGFLKILYGAPMREPETVYNCVYTEKPPYEVVQTEWLNKDEMLQLHAIEDMLDRLYNSGRFRHTLKYILDASLLTPFELFDFIGKEIYPVNNIPLDDFTDKLMECFIKLKGVDKTSLRDNMLIDRLQTNSSGRIPNSLKIYDKQLKKYKQYLNSNEDSKQLLNTIRSIAILYSMNKLAFVDYTNKNTEYYNINFIDLNSINIEND